MPVGSRRVKGVRPRQAVGCVARRVLANRFEAVHYFLPRAAKRPEEDIEYVHQLRVATRRGLAAMALFGDLLPRRRARLLERELKSLRRAAGDARDLDVLATWIRKKSGDQDLGDCQAVIDAIWLHRLEAQRSIVKVYESFRRSRFRRRTRALIDKTHWRCQFREPQFGAVAAGIAYPYVSAFFVTAAVDLTDIAALHAMRIQGKKLRYALELLAPPPSSVHCVKTCLPRLPNCRLDLVKSTTWPRPEHVSSGGPDRPAFPPVIGGWPAGL